LCVCVCVPEQTSLGDLMEKGVPYVPLRRSAAERETRERERERERESKVMGILCVMLHTCTHYTHAHHTWCVLRTAC